jgi:hypothetical protein
VTSCRWQERHPRGGKRDDLGVARVTLRGIRFDVVAWERHFKTSK